MDWIIFFTILLIIFLAILYLICLPSQLKEWKLVGKKHKKMIKKDKKNICLNYLNYIDKLPIWRFCLLQAFIISIFCILFICLITKDLTARKLLAIYLVIFLISFIVTYKSLGHRYWHYVNPI